MMRELIPFDSYNLHSLALPDLRITEFVLIDNLALLLDASSSTIMVFDITNSNQIHWLTNQHVIPDNGNYQGYDIKVSNQTIFVASKRGLLVIDMHDIYHMELLQEFSLQFSESIAALEVVDDLLFANDLDGLQIYKILTNNQLMLIDGINYRFFATKIITQGNYTIVHSMYEGFLAFNNSGTRLKSSKITSQAVTTKPLIKFIAGMSAQALSTALEFNYPVITTAEQNGKIQFFNLDLLQESLIFRYQIPAVLIHRITAYHNLLFATLFFGYSHTELRVFDASNPSNLTAIASHDFSGVAGYADLEIKPPYVYVLQGYDFRVYNISNIEDIHLSGAYTSMHNYLDFYLHQEYALFTGGTNSVAVLHLPPLSQSILDHYTLNSAQAIEITANARAYVVEVVQLKIFDISDPTHITLLTAYSVPNRGSPLQDIKIFNENLFITSTNRLHILHVDINDNVISIKDYTFAGPKVYFHQAMMFVLEIYRNKIMIFNIDDLSNLVQVAEYYSNSQTIDLSIYNDDVALLATEYPHAIEVLQINNLPNITQLHNTTVPQQIHKMAQRNEYIYLNVGGGIFENHISIYQLNVTYHLNFKNSIVQNSCDVVKINFYEDLMGVVCGFFTIIYDVSNVTIPMQKAVVKNNLVVINYNTNKIIDNAFYGDSFYSLAGNDLQAFNLTSLINNQISIYSTPLPTRKIQGFSDIAIIDQGENLLSLNISDINTIQRLAIYEGDVRFTDFKYYQGKIYALTEASQLEILSINQHGNMTRIFPNEESSEKLEILGARFINAIQDDLVAISFENINNGCHVINITNATHPVIVGGVNNLEPLNDLTMNQDTIYAIWGQTNLQAYNLSLLQQATIKQLNLDNSVIVDSHLDAQNQLTIASEQGIKTFNISDLEFMHELHELQTTNAITRIDRRNDTFFTITENLSNTSFNTFKLVPPPILSHNQIHLGRCGNLTLNSSHLSALDYRNQSSDKILFRLGDLRHANLWLNQQLQNRAEYEITHQQLNSGQVMLQHDGSQYPPSYWVAATYATVNRSVQQVNSSLQIGPAPTLLNPIQTHNVTVNQSFVLQLPPDIFVDTICQQKLLLTARWQNRSLPAEVQFDQNNATFFGTIKHPRQYNISVTATNTANLSTSMLFMLNALIDNSVNRHNTSASDSYIDQWLNYGLIFGPMIMFAMLLIVCLWCLKERRVSRRPVFYNNNRHGFFQGSVDDVREQLQLASVESTFAQNPQPTQSDQQFDV